MYFVARRKTTESISWKLVNQKNTMRLRGNDHRTFKRSGMTLCFNEASYRFFCAEVLLFFIVCDCL